MVADEDKEFYIFRFWKKIARWLELHDVDLWERNHGGGHSASYVDGETRDIWQYQRRQNIPLIVIQFTPLPR
jgi:hypothetical protein